jgi:hypothetical protein
MLTTRYPVDFPCIFEELDEGFSLEDLLPGLGHLELKALDRVQHGDVPQGV